MDKTELLFRMMEQPEKYDEGQWREILSDKQCRDLYSMMSATKSALDAERYDQQADDATLQQEWERLVLAHPQSASRHYTWRRIAAAVAGFAIFFGIVVAAVQTHGFGLIRGESAGIHDESAAGVTGRDTSREATAGQDEIPTLDDGTRLYDNVPLEQIISDLAARYDVDVEWQSDDVKSLRLYYLWEPSYSIDKVVDMLGSFESFSIKRAGDKLIISEAPTQGK